MNKVNCTQLTKEDTKIRLSANMKLVSEFKKQPSLEIKEKQPKIFVYNVKTYTKDIEGVTSLVPYALGWCEVDLVNKSFKPVTIVEDNNKDYIFDIMFDQITKLPDLPNEIQLFAHNGANLDNVFSKEAKNIKLVSQIDDDMHIANKILECCFSNIELHNDIPFFIFSLLPVGMIFLPLHLQTL